MSGGRYVTKIFVYHTLKSHRNRLKAMGHDVHYVPAKLEHHRDVEKDGYPTLERYWQATVKGDVLDVNDSDLKKLDAWEDRYKRETVILKDKTRAQTYVLKK
jgi:gamma-glutamylcyclotransferase (GGCT)/AIG2-like uncharacterized protein YtfP